MVVVPSFVARAVAPSKKTFLLVHGAWHGGWCYSLVDNVLTAKGHKVFRPTLTGLGERSHLLSKNVTLDTHIADVVNLIEWENLNDVVLCGHSYGGWVIGGVVERVLPRISSIVFLDAYIPENGRAFIDVFPRKTRIAIKTLLRNGAVSIPPPSIRSYGLTAPLQAWVESKLTPQPIHTWVQKITLSGALNRVPKKTYIWASRRGHSPFRVTYTRLKSRPSWRTYRIPSGHDAMIEMPERLAEILLQAA